MRRLLGLSGVGGAPTLDSDAAWVVEAYERYFKYVWALVGRLGVPASGIEDAVQEVFLILHRRRDDFRGQSQVRTWLHGITVNVARRHRERHARASHEPMADEPASPGPSPERATADRAQLEQLDRWLSELAAEQREVFVLSEIAELGAPEIAEVLGVKLNTVYSRLRLARRHLQRRLDASQARRSDDGAA